MIDGLKMTAESGNIIISRTSGLSYNVYALERLPNGIPVNTLYLNKGYIKRQKYIEGSMNIIPFISINYSEVNKLYSDLVDALLQLGVKPKTEIVTKEEKNALQFHLDDMRKIVSKELKVDL